MDYAKFLIDDKYNIDYVIYRFKNKINGKVYIGQTTKSLRKRVIQHMTNSRPTTKSHKSYFHRALYKYGIENFSLDVVERCNTKEELDEREIYWIAYYNSTNKNFGYNIEIGGRNGAVGRKLSEEHKSKLLLANLGNHRNDYTKQQLRLAHKAKWQDPEFRKAHINNIMKIAGINSKPVYQYDTNGNFIKKWPSGQEVSRYLYDGNSKASISRNIKLNMKRNKLGFMKNGSIWSYYSPKERRAY